MKHRFVTIVLLFALILACGAGSVTPARADTTTISENFDGALPGWTLLGSAAQDTGWLRLTPASASQTGAAFYTTAFSTAGNVFDVQFDYASHDGTGADGLAFFMLDGSASPTAPGGAGSGLGYTGISGGYFGVGLDEYGGFGGRAAGVDNVAIRQGSNTSALVSVLTTIAPVTRDGKKHVRVAFANNKVSVWIAGTLLINEQALASTLPATVKFGFSGATGGMTNIHEVDNLTVVVRSPILLVTQSGGTTWPCGDTWTNACSLQTALTNAISGDEIWAAAGTYKPTTGTDRTAAFQLRVNVAVYGGFDGVDDAARTDRNPAANVATLSGDIGAGGNNSDNSYHVVTGATGATLDGFTITAGNANGADNLGLGGGMFNNGSSPTVTNIIFTGNSAVGGAGMANNSNSNPTVTNVTFTAGTASWEGGGMGNYASSPTVTNVTFSGNTAVNGGGGMFNSTNSTPVLKNVTFNGNSASGAGSMGGGLYNYQSSGGIQIYNTIFWGNTAVNGAQIYNRESTNVTITNSVVAGGCPAGSTCPAIVTTDPLLGTLGNYGGSTQTVPLLPGSSAIDAGNAAYCTAGSDQRGVSYAGTCDIGAFESRGFALTKTGGDNQSAAINTAFATPLGLTVASAYSEPVNGGLVTFTAPASGASLSVMTPFTRTISGGAVSTSVTANGTAGVYDVAASASGAANVLQFRLSNTEPNDFVITVKTDNGGSSGSTQFTIPTTGGGYNYNVDCNNDGVNEAAAQTGDYTCNYAAAGTYTVRIKDNSGAGTGFPHICFDCGGDKLKLLTIEQWGKGKWTSMAWAFAGCANLAGQATDSPDLSGVTDMSWMFASASAFNQDIGNWNTVSVTDMSYMFYDASAFNQDIGNWNTANVTDMSGMFYYASAFNQDLGGWNVGALTDASYMFTGVTLSTPNYDALLIGWDAQTLHSGVTFNGGYSKYCAGEAARSNMISSDHWNITDGGKQCPPAVAPAVTASKNPGSNDVILSWDDNAANAGGYVIWYSETPYFLPDDPAAQSILRPAGSTGWTHASAAGDPAHNYYYIVQGINAAGDRSAASNRTGVFGFSMTPGALNLR